MYNKMKYGFTLAELMAVVIIVALLAILSTGYYRRSVEQSRFSEGLMAASAVVESINRICLERRLNGGTCGQGEALRLNQLDVNFPGTSCTNDQCETTYFTIVGDTTTVVARRKDGIYAGAYNIQMQTHFAATNRDRIACGTASDAGEAFCEAMGYTSCAQHLCTKPN